MGTRAAEECAVVHGLVVIGEGWREVGRRLVGEVRCEVSNNENGVDCPFGFMYCTVPVPKYV